MKTLFAALLVVLMFSVNAYAKKPEITSTWNSGEMILESVDGLGCKFVCGSPFIASYYTHRDAILGLQLLVGDTVTGLGTWLVPDDTGGTVVWYSGCFYIPVNAEWSMVWVLESTKNGRVIDAEETLSGICAP